MTAFACGIWMCAFGALCSDKNPRWAKWLGAIAFALPLLGYAAGVLR